MRSMPARWAAALAVALTLAMSLPAVAQVFQEVVKEADRATGRVITRVSKGVATGSGVVLADLGDGSYHFLTNNHVIDGGLEYVIGFKVGSDIFIYGGQVVARSDPLDLAVLRIRPLEPTAHKPGILRVAVRDVQKGESVAALGFPGVADLTGDGMRDPAYFESTLTLGSVSRVTLGSWQSGARKLEIIQHTATINPGNSGGPLLDLCAQVIGLNTQKVVYTGDGKTPAEGTFFSSSPRTIAEFLQASNIGFSAGRTEFRQGREGCASAAPTPPPNTVPATPAGADTSGARGIGPMPVWGIVALSLGGIAILIGGASQYYRHRGEAGPKLSEMAAFGSSGGVGDNKVILTLRGPDGRNIPLNAEQLRRGATIGRAPTNTIALTNRMLSREHARIELKGRTLTITDLGSSNGTTVDGERLKPRTLRQINSQSRIAFGGVPVTLSRPDV